MTRTKLISTDMVFAVSVGLIAYATDGFQKKGILVLLFLLIFAFSMCLKAHFDYYKLNKKIY